MRRAWTSEDDTRLINLIKDPSHKRSVQDIAEVMGRSQASVKHRGARLGYAHVGRAKTPRYDDSFIEQIVRWQASGVTQREIGQRLGLSKGNISTLLATRGKQRKINYWTPEEDDWIRASYPDRSIRLDGLPGRTAKAVIGRAQILGLNRPVGQLKGCPGHKRQFDEAEVCRRYQEMGTLQLVANTYRSCPEVIARILRKHNVPLLPGNPSRVLADKDAVIADYKANKESMVQLAEKYGFSSDAIREQLKAWGVYDPRRAALFQSRKSVQDCWVETFGEEEGNKRWTEYVAKRKQTARRGKDNPSYGRPSPQGAGNGWKGWYRDHYFRSLREACCMIEMDLAEISWETGETLSIPYVFMDTERTYRPDYIVGTHLIEVKPIKLHNSPSVAAKHQGALVYGRAHGFTYELVDVTIDAEALHEAWAAKLIRFDRDYEARFIAYIETHKG